MDEQKQLASGSVGLSPGATLKWLAVSDSCAPVTLDSAGVLRLWSAAFGGSWLPVATHDSLPDEHFWPLGIMHGELRYTACAAGTEPEVCSQHPNV